MFQLKNGYITEILIEFCIFTTSTNNLSDGPNKNPVKVASGVPQKCNWIRVVSVPISGMWHLVGTPTITKGVVFLLLEKSSF